MPAYDSGAAWVGDRLMVVGGAGQAPWKTSGTTGYSNGAWIWTP